MSYTIWLEIDTGGGHKAEIDFDLNYTSNVSPMWRKALAVEFLGDAHGRRAGDCAPALRRAIAAMDADPAAYQAMNPPNGWGNAEGAREVLVRLAHQCETHPAAEVRISR